MRVPLETYRRLVAAGIIANVEYIEGEVVMGDHGLELSAVQRAAAAKVGITLEPPKREGREARERAIADTAGAATGAYCPDYLERLRGDWPE